MAEDVGIDHLLNLIAEGEFVEDFLHIGRKAIQIIDEVIAQALALAAGRQACESEFGCVVERLASRHAQRTVLLYDAMLVEKFFTFQNHVLGGFEHGIEPAQYGEGQDDVAVLAAHVHVAQTVIGNVPDEVGDPLELALIHDSLFYVLFMFNCRRVRTKKADPLGPLALCLSAQSILPPSSRAAPAAPCRGSRSSKHLRFRRIVPPEKGICSALSWINLIASR